ncbi:glycosyl transferase family group 2-domain-containing protein [Favolaschia claudopus]|uniref:Glycosyl transferase family group 2-domain-containing protein n=1 Tax=Favolaschia claudopus TaxID=2862362 RepID=A0AAW0DXM1_9AGAR
MASSSSSSYTPPGSSGSGNPSVSSSASASSASSIRRPHPTRVPSPLARSPPSTSTSLPPPHPLHHQTHWPDSPASSAVSFNVDVEYVDDIEYVVEDGIGLERMNGGLAQREMLAENGSGTGRAGVTILTSDYDEVDALLHSIYEKTQQDAWFAPPPSAGAIAHASLGGVAIRVAAPTPVAAGTIQASPPYDDNSGASTPKQPTAQAEFRVFPYNAPYLVPFEAAVRGLNPAGAVLVRNAAVTAVCGRVTPTAQSVLLDAATRIQVLGRLGDLPGAEKDQCGAFIRTPPSLILWSPAVDVLPSLAAEFEEKLIKFIWRTRGLPASSSSSSSQTSLSNSNSQSTTAPPINRRRDSHAAPGLLASLFGAPSASVSSGSATGRHPHPLVQEVARGEVEMEGVVGESTLGLTMMDNPSESRFREVDLSGGVDEKGGASRVPVKTEIKKKDSTFFGWSWRLQPKSQSTPDPEKLEEGGSKKRKLVLLGPLYAGLGAGLAGYFVFSGVSVLLAEYALDGDPRRFALILTLPVIFCVSIFFCLQLIGNISLVIGPVKQYHENSAFYSAVKPAPNPAVDNNLPHITIQCPVYKESLSEVIAPSVLSVKKAMQTYARQGGTSAIFICDDGMQLISEEDRQARMRFYADHNIGWTARPGHNKDGFFRKGKFKKASNMNYGLALSLKLEKHLAALEAAGVTEDDGECLEDKAMYLAVEETYEESGRRHRPWACNGKSLRVGEIILIIDSDTIVPEDCFRDAAREMYESPDLAIIQHESDVMQVAHHYFENGITHFTRRINKCISYGCSNGEVAPFVGHNAFLRWSAVQDAAFDDPDDGKRKQWSESNVSEDFDLALRLLLGGYTLRWATYSEGGFKEGVSLTVVDEMARWQKYAYGCDEIIFNPLIRWWRKGPISDQLRGFVWSIAPVHYKIGMMSCGLSSFYGIAAATVGSIMNFLLLGLAPQLDRFYLHSFEILLACTVVFPGLGNLGFTLLEYRLGHRSFFGALFENLRWVPFFLFFFGGLSIHLSTAILAHLFSYDMTWGSTVKEVERSTFWIEVPRIWQRFKLSFIICFAAIVMMIVMQSNAVPFQWQIPGWNWALNIPLSLVVGCHILLPIVLNPYLMIFSY